MILGEVVTVERNRNGDCLGGSRSMSTNLSVVFSECVYQMGRDLTLSYFMKISQPIASCVAHAGKVCHLYSNGSIDGARVPYGSWLQVETCHDARKKAKRRRFGFNADEELNLSEDDSNAQQPFAATTPNCPGNNSGERQFKETACSGTVLVVVPN
ncbi:hypothetical protein ACFX12_003676 [Malus domestica]